MASRILLKLSGELLSEREGFGINPETLSRIISEVSELHNRGLSIGIVIGGGNIFRGRSLIKDLKFPPPKAHHMGMVATVINGIALETALNDAGCPALHFSAFPVGTFAGIYDRDEVLRGLKSHVVILTGGTGNPYFSTDTAAALRAAETGAELLIKATKVDGVYDKDPIRFPDAARFDTITYQEYLRLGLEVMDQSAVSLCRDQKIPILVFDFSQKGNLEKVLTGDLPHTVIR
ncbi:MAG TPA: UMP kinase [Candidatus Mcinerneyibacteriales bacterium]|jgi:uridylate kinase|nr:UMP kinase [Candidatus Mcinerneyibacteriales bacterium]